VNQRLYRKVVTRIRNLDMDIVYLCLAMDEVDGGLADDVAKLGDQLMTIYETLDERKKDGTYDEKP